KIVEMTGSSSRVEIGALSYRPNEIWRMYGDSTRARDLLGWKPSIDLESGLAKTVEWFGRQALHAEVQHVP
ncbi:MAG TPA: GDP-mannose 4,6-dehydratase, partial [Candidatus Sulfotelmatobacter sp.]|nr:GDP-mannose 4,6-dehydratase [Candidatus Sulfotelmatobacter sp.]